MIFTVYGELYSSKNSRRILYNKATGRMFVAKSALARADEQELCNKLLCLRRSWDCEKKRHLKPYRIVFKIYRKTRRRFDYINIIQNLCDCMVKAGLLNDDNADELLPVFEPYEVDGTKPRVEMEFDGDSVAAHDLPSPALVAREITNRKIPNIFASSKNRDDGLNRMPDGKDCHALRARNDEKKRARNDEREADYDGGQNGG